MRPERHIKWRDDDKILQFVKDGHQVGFADFVVGDRGDERVTHTKKNGLWFVSGQTVADYSVNQVIESYKADPSIQIKSELIDTGKKQKVVIKKSSHYIMLEPARFMLAKEIMEFIHAWLSSLEKW